MKAELHIQAALRANKTFLKQAYHTTPLKIANITEDRSQKTLQLMSMSSSPGILDGDEYNIKIEVAENCSLQLQTQSYQRLFNMKKGASQNMEVYLGKNASFSYLPHPVVPHVNSNFIARNNIFLASGCRLLWAEVLTCGRKLNGEEFLFSNYQNKTSVFLNNRLIVKENLVMKPAVVDVKAIGQLEGFTHQASVIYINEAAAIPASIEELQRLLEVHNDICFGISALPVSGLVIRLLGNKGEQLHAAVNQIALFLQNHDKNKKQNIIKAEVHAD